MKTAVILALLSAISISEAHAQATTCNLKNPSCSSLASTCKAFNRKAGAPTGRCDEYRAACMQTGTWQDRNCTRTNVRKR